MLQRVFTQNIDGLDYQTGIRRELVTNVHGSIANVTCEGCGRGMAFDAFCDRLRKQIKDIYGIDPSAPKDPQTTEWNVWCAGIFVESFAYVSF